MSSSSWAFFLEDLDLAIFVFPEFLASSGGARRSGNVSSGGLQRR